VSTNDLVAF